MIVSCTECSTRFDRGITNDNSTCPSCGTNIDMQEKQGPLTWWDVSNLVRALPAERRGDTAMVRGMVIEEFSPVIGFGVSKAGDDELDEGQLYLEFDG